MDGVGNEWQRLGYDEREDGRVRVECVLSRGREVR